jgi:hypothetical protein
MTAELADCYKTKKEGVEDILNKVEKSFNCPIYVFDVNGNFLTPEEAKKNYLNVSASNWNATAKFVAEFIKDSCILVDMGSTTTDIIPIKDNEILAEKTDLDRLMNNQLVYVGTLRTPVSFLSNKIEFRGKSTNLSSEYFAITADISLILNKISEDDYTCDTPDGAGKDFESCLTRLARVLCADRELVKDDEIIDFANKEVKKGKVPKEGELELLYRARNLLEQGRPLRADRDLPRSGLLRGYAFLSIKPLLVVINSGEDVSTPELTLPPYTESLEIKGRLEAELLELPPEEAAIFREEWGLREAALPRLTPVSPCRVRWMSRPSFTVNGRGSQYAGRHGQ